MTREYWEKKFETPDYFGTKPQPFAKECADFLKKQHAQGQELLDLGCGQGQDSIYFSQLGYKVTAVDYSVQSLASIKDKNITVIQRDIRKLDVFSDNKFDIVYSNLALHLFGLEELRHIFSEIHRILTPEGFCLFTMKKKNDKNYGKGEKIADETFVYKGVTRYFIPKDMLRDLLKEFHILKLEEGSHTQKGALEVYWKVFTQKK